MTVFPSGLVPLLPTIHPWSLESMGMNLVMMRNNFGGNELSSIASATYPSANRAYYLPFVLPHAARVTTLFCYNGAVVSGNIDVGIYDAVRTRIVSSGSTVQSGTNTLQTFDIADTILGAGSFYLAVAMDNTTGTLFRIAAFSFTGGPGTGLAAQATAFPLPATAIFATASSIEFFPAIGLLLGPRTVI